MALGKADDIGDEDSFAIWLNRQPQEIRRGIVTCISHRASLRVLPFILINQSNPVEDRLIIAVFRCSAIARLGCIWPVDKVASKAAAKSVYRVLAKGDQKDNSYHAARVSAAVALGASAPDLTVESITNVVDAANEFLFPVAFTDLWHEIRTDASFIEKNQKIETLLSCALWESVPVWWRDENLQSDSFLKLNAFSRSNFFIWGSWYETIASGNEIFHLSKMEAQKVAVKIATGNGKREFWDRKADVINAEIAGWVEEARQPPHIAGSLDFTEEADRVEGTATLGDAIKIEPQNPLVATFISDDVRPIDIDKSNGVGAVALTNNNRDSHSEVRRLSTQLLSKIEGVSNLNNGDSLLVPDIKLFRVALGRKLENLRPALFIPRGDRLRQRLEAQSDDLRLSDERPLSDNTRDALSGIVRAYNMFVSLDKALSDRDLALLGPDTEENLVRPDVIIQVVVAAQNAKIITEAAAAAPIEAAQVAPDEPDPTNRRSIAASETAKNLGRAILSFLKSTWKIGSRVVEGSKNLGLKIAGASGVAIFAAGWAIQHETWLLATFNNHPTMVEAIKTILAFIKALPL